MSINLSQAIIIDYIDQDFLGEYLSLKSRLGKLHIVGISQRLRFSKPGLIM